ncbi:putative developmental regulator flbA [Fusarium proliferatum ET1]|uniref:Probable developmental regulator flbA n=1 Tax=Fusarium proliferatum (strain ET1) TaxID=1227346 RepID=A0A1L7V8N4_FUSPR|nr:putative developmental regulator flbA [Fusarium proliferatum ET1]CZR37158.1 probable developmental regulator flbA [Fusarium proliferatum ET1]
MATLSQDQRPTVHSASPSDTPLALDHDQDQDTTTNTPRSSISDRSPLPTPLPPAHINTSATSGNSFTSTSTSITNQPTSVPYHPQQSHHRHTASSVSRLNNRSSTSLFALAASAFDRTQNAIAAISEPAIRPRQSSGALSRLSLLTSSSPSSEPSSPDKYHRLRSSSNQSLSSGAYLDSKVASQTLQANNPPSQPYTSTDPNLPPPIKSSTANKMHQTSSRLLRMTDDDRPFTKDFKDLFSTLVVSLLPLSAHRVRLTKVEYTFLSEDAINNLGSLKFSQSNRMPDPKDPSRIVTTTTTTTFSMAKDMARSICQRFLEARFIESADGKYQQVYTMKGSVWQLTPKGITVLDRFCARNGIQQKQVSELANLASTQLVLLERDPQTDKLLHDQGTIEVIFRRFAGSEGRNIKTTVNAADSDSLHDYRDGLTGVKMAAERKVNGKTYRDTFTGKATTDWLMDCSTIVDKRETVEVATLFVEYELMEPVAQDRAYMSQNPGCNLFQPTKYAIYQLSQRGKDLVSGAASRGRPSESEGGAASQRNGITRDSNTQRLDKILNDPALRLLFREQLRDTHCEENLSFYQDVDEFVRSCKAATRAAQKSPNTNAMDGIKEIMASAYGIYNAFLAPGSPCELNIDHQLRNNLATRMTKAVGQDVAMIDTLQEVTSLFEDAQNAVFKLMASDSVPKFLRSPKYEQQLRNYEFDVVGRGPERSQSRSNRK